MTDAITISRYEGGQIQKISADLAHLEDITPGAGDLVAPGRDTVAARPGGRAITAAIGGRLVGFMLCLPDDAEAGPDLIPGRSSLSAFTRSALRVLAPVVAPAATSLGVSEALLDAALREQPDGRIFAVLPGAHPANRVARAAGWHEVARSRYGMQLLLHPGHPALAALLVRE
jgi:GNAT superfamily N-acetyltransferase